MYRVEAQTRAYTPADREINCSYPQSGARITQPDGRPAKSKVQNPTPRVMTLPCIDDCMQSSGPCMRMRPVQKPGNQSGNYYKVL